MNLLLKIKGSVSLVLGIGLSLLLLVCPPYGDTGLVQAQCTNRCYVNGEKTVVTMTNGMSWATAFTNLQDALTVAQDGTSIWVAKGVYYPDEGGGRANNDRESNFALKNGVEIYGGFAGTETLRSQRQASVNVTVLSGDLEQNDLTDKDGVVTTTAHIRGLNAYHVIRNTNVSSTAVLDGFTITAGNNDLRGGGMVNSIDSSPQLRQLSFSGNHADLHGGGMYNWRSSPQLSQVSFSGNSALLNGGGMYNLNKSRPQLSQVSFSGNWANNGGGMYNSESSPQLSQVSFSGNFATNNGGGMFSGKGSSPKISGSIFWLNASGSLASAQIANATASTPTFSYSLLQGSGGSERWNETLGTDGGHNLDEDPRFLEPLDPQEAPTTAGNLRLTPGCSPAIDAGRNDLAKDEVDLDGAKRIQGVAVDLGAYESTPESCLSLSKSVSPARVELSQTVTYTLVLSNRGAGEAAAVRLTDTLPSGLTFQRSLTQPDGAVQFGQVLTWTGTMKGQGLLSWVYLATTPATPRTLILTNTVLSSGPTTELLRATAAVTVNGRKIFLPLVSQ